MKKFAKEWLIGAFTVWLIPFFNIEGANSLKEITEEEKKEIEEQVHKLFRRYIIIWACFAILLSMNNVHIIWSMTISAASISVLHGFGHCFLIFTKDPIKNNKYFVKFYTVITFALLGYTMAEVFKKLMME